MTDGPVPGARTAHSSRRLAPVPFLVVATQRISANAIAALRDALAAAFWFKSDLYDYARAAVGGEPLFLAGIDWTGPQLKRDSASLFVDRLVREQDEHQDVLLALLVDVAAMDDCRRRQPGRCRYEKDIGRRWRRCDTITLDGNQFCSDHAPSPGVSAAATYAISERVAAKVQACETPIGLPGCISEMTGDEFELWLATLGGRVLFVPALGELFTVECGGATPAPTRRPAAP